MVETRLIQLSIVCPSLLLWSKPGSFSFLFCVTRCCYGRNQAHSLVYCVSLAVVMVETRLIQLSILHLLSVMAETRLIQLSILHLLSVVMVETRLIQLSILHLLSVVMVETRLIQLSILHLYLLLWSKPGSFSCLFSAFLCCELS